MANFSEASVQLGETPKPRPYGVYLVKNNSRSPTIGHTGEGFAMVQDHRLTAYATKDGVRSEILWSS